MSDTPGDDSGHESGDDGEPETDESALGELAGAASDGNRDRRENNAWDKDESQGAGGTVDRNGEDLDALADPDNPFSDLEGMDDPDITSDEMGDFFEPVETTDIDDEALWDAVLSTDEDSGDATGGADAVVSKHQFCKVCEFFSAPPDVACNSPGTEIAELVGIDQFRVRNCPIVAQRHRTGTAFPDE